jgi:hypothetical protein
MAEDMRHLTPKEKQAVFLLFFAGRNAKMHIMRNGFFHNMQMYI